MQGACLGSSVCTAKTERIRSVTHAELQVYAPWCGHCKTLAPIYEQLAARFKGVDSVVIAKMDGTENEHPSLDVEGYPSIMFYPAGNKVSAPGALCDRAGFLLRACAKVGCCSGAGEAGGVSRLCACGSDAHVVRCPTPCHAPPARRSFTRDLRSLCCAVIEYEDDRSLEALIKFIENNAKTDFDLDTSATAAPGTDSVDGGAGANAKDEL